MKLSPIEINPTKLSEEVENIEIDRKNSYILSYKYFLSYFENIKTIREENLIIWVFFVYGWMPTILKKLNTTDNQSLILELSNKVKNGGILDISELNEIKKYINNSIVWASKFLHFLRPDIYPIFDSKIAKQLWRSRNINDINTYYEYFEKINNIKNSVEVRNIQDFLSQKFWYTITSVRALEFALFSINDKK